MENLFLDTALNVLTFEERLKLENFLLRLRDPVIFTADYSNWRGETRKRVVRPIEYWLGETQWHNQPTLFLKAIDLEKDAMRDFSVMDFDTETIKLMPLDLTRGVEGRSPDGEVTRGVEGQSPDRDIK